VPSTRRGKILELQRRVRLRFTIIDVIERRQRSGQTTGRNQVTNEVMNLCKRAHHTCNYSYIKSIIDMMLRDKQIYQIDEKRGKAHCGPPRIKLVYLRDNEYDVLREAREEMEADYR
jgi:hypothetical protein